MPQQRKKVRKAADSVRYDFIKLEREIGKMAEVTPIPCTVYIDEAGDLGANKGTKWFVLTAVIVDTAEEPLIRVKLGDIKRRLNLQSIHFRNVKDFNRRSFIVRSLADSNFICSHVFFDTQQYDRTKMPTDLLAYNYICRYLLERVSWYLRDTGRIGRIVLSSRGTSRDADLINYIQDKLLSYSNNEIAPVFTGIECKQATSWDMLQLADICATSMFYSHEVNAYGTTTPCFALKLRNKIYQHNGQSEHYGLKYFNDNMKPNNLRTLRPCK